VKAARAQQCSDFHPAGQRMSAGDERDDPFAANDLTTEIGAQLGAQRDRDVDQAGPQRRPHLHVPHLLGHDGHVGMVAPKRPPDRRQRLKTRRSAERDPQSAELPAGDAPRRIDGEIERLEDTPGAEEEHLPCIGERDVARRARQQLCPEVPLELPDRGAQRWLRHVEPVRRPAEVQLLRDRDEVAKMTVLDHRSFVMWSRTAGCCCETRAEDAGRAQSASSRGPRISPESLSAGVTIAETLRSARTRAKTPNGGASHDPQTWGWTPPAPRQPSWTGTSRRRRALI
jgi:hypothetical protein